MRATGGFCRTCPPQQPPTAFTCVLIGTAVAPSPPVVPRDEGDSAMSRIPDEDYDVIAYECRGTWTIWLRGETLGELETQAPC